MHRHAGIEHERFVRAAEIVQPEPREAELGSLADKLLRGVIRVAQLGE